jgi:RNA polymerase sigma-70 factor (ECF subfamily)
MAIEAATRDFARGGDMGIDPELDATLVRQVIGGSQEALAALYDRHSSAVFAAAMRASGDRWIAAEVVQETFLALWDRAELFDASRGSLPGWLARIARNRSIDRLRAAARRERAATFSSFARTGANEQSIAEWLTASGELIGAAGPEPVPDIAVTDKETRAAIEHALSSLDPMERRVIVLAYDGGLSQSEIAALLSWPIGTVKTRTRRALRHLRDRLEQPDVGATSAGMRDARTGSENAHASHRDVRAIGFGNCLAPC